MPASSASSASSAASNPFGMKLRKPNVNFEIKSGGKFDVKLKKVTSNSQAKKNETTFGVELKKTGGKKTEEEEATPSRKDGHRKPFGVRLKRPDQKKSGGGGGGGGDGGSDLIPPSTALNEAKSEPDDHRPDTSGATPTDAAHQRKMAPRREGEIGVECVTLKKTPRRKERERETREEARLKKGGRRGRGEEEWEGIKLKRVERKNREEGKEKSGVNLKKVERKYRELDKERIGVKLKKVERKKMEGGKERMEGVNLKRVEGKYGEREKEGRREINLRRVERKLEEEEGKVRGGKGETEREVGEEGHYDDDDDDYGEDEETEYSLSDYSSSDDDYGSNISDDDNGADESLPPPTPPFARPSPDGTISLTWEDRDDAIGYIVERRTNRKEGWDPVCDGTLKETIDTTVEEKSVYEYRVTVVKEDHVSATSRPSVAVRAQRKRAEETSCESAVFPGPPRNVLAMADARESVSVTWDEPTIIGQNEILGYVVEKRETGGQWIRVNDTPLSQRRARVDSSRSGQVMRVRVLAVTLAGEGEPSQPSAPVVAATSAHSTDSNPGTPKVVDLTPNSVSLSWKAASSSKGFTGYGIEKKTTQGLWVPVNRQLIPNTDFKVSHLREDESHEFRVVTYDENHRVNGKSRGCKARTSKKSDIESDGLDVYDASTEARASFIHVTWRSRGKQKATSDVEGERKKFVVEKSVDEGEWKKITGSVSSNEIHYTDYLPGHAYRFRVRALDDEGFAGRPGAASNVVIGAAPPTPPTFDASLQNVVARVGENADLAAPFRATTQSEVTWWKDGKPASLGERSRSEIGDDLATLYIQNCKRKDRGEYEVELRNEYGVARGKCMLDVVGPPSAPEGPLQAFMVAEKSVMLEWGASEDDGGCPIEGYRVEGRKIGKKSWRVFASRCRTTNMEIPHLSHNVAYEFRVAAVSAEGTSSALQREFHAKTGSGDDRYKMEPAVPARSRAEKAKTASRSKQTTSAPRFTFTLRPRTIQVGNSVKFICCVEGTPYPRITWYKDSKVLDPLSPRHVWTTSSGVCSLEVTDCAETDGGVYVCVAGNSRGTEETGCRLKVEGARKPKKI